MSGNAFMKRTRLRNNFLKYRCDANKELIILKEISRFPSEKSKKGSF